MYKKLFPIDRKAINRMEGAGNSVPDWGLGQRPNVSLVKR